MSSNVNMMPSNVNTTNDTTATSTKANVHKADTVVVGVSMDQTRPHEASNNDGTIIGHLKFVVH